MSFRLWDESVPRSALIAGWCTILAWLLVGTVFLYTAPDFLSSTGAGLHAPSRSRSAVASSLYNTYFNHKITNPGDVVMLVVQSVTGVNNSDVASYSHWVQATLGTSPWHRKLGVVVGGIYLPSLDGGPTSWMLSEDTTATILMVVATKGTGQHQAFEFIDYLEKNITYPGVVRSESNANYTVDLFGDIVFDKQINGKSEASLQKMELTVLPFAFIVIAYFLQHVQLIIVPLACVSLSLGTAFTCALPIAKRWSDVSNETPEVMVSAAAALSIDYSLFLLTRFLEELHNGNTMWQAIVDMVVHTGHTICVSGFLISVAFFSGLLMPIDTIRSAGACAGITALCTVLINITMIPALLVCFGRLLTASLPAAALRCWQKIKLCFSAPSSWKHIATDDTSSNLNPNLYICNGDESDEDVALKPKQQKKGLWMRMALRVRDHAGCVIVIVLLMGLPLLIQVPKLSISVDRLLTTPRGARCLGVMRQLEAKGMQTGRTSPLNMVFKGDMVSPAGFAAMQELSSGLLETIKAEGGETLPDMLQGPTSAWGTPLNYSDAMALAESNTSFGIAYERLLESTTADNGTYSLLQVFAPFSRLNPKATPWLRKVRVEVDKFNKKYDTVFKAYASASAAGDIDAGDLVEGRMPFVLGCTVVGVTVLVAVVFRSLVLPLRLAFALAYTVLVTLGVAVVVYQTSTFWWLFPYLSDFDNGGLSYTVPAIVIPVTIALGLDYDIFLITRIIEYRQSGLSDEMAVVMGTAATGPTISGAGVIMSIAFGGLLSSSETMLNQFGLILTVSVLLDTFVIRTVLVPALMIKATKWNWWPRVMPEPSYDWPHVQYDSLPQAV